MRKPPANLSKTDLAKLDLYTAKDMTFVIRKGEDARTIPRFTPCKKPKYTREIKDYLVNMEEKHPFRPKDAPFAVCVELEGMLRYVWRTDVLTQKEYDEARKADKVSLGVFLQKRQRAVGEDKVPGGSDNG